jgi:FKBP-type peptidyl-prolyl cis-trans isomerase (trigger factor)
LYAQTAEFNIKSHYILEEIKKTEKVNVSESDKETMIIEAAKNLKMDMENYKKMYKKQIESEDFKHAIIESKLLKMIEENSKFIPYPKKENKENNKDKKNK